MGAGEITAATSMMEPHAAAGFEGPEKKLEIDYVIKPGSDPRGALPPAPVPVVVPLPPLGEKKACSPSSPAPPPGGG